MHWYGGSIAEAVTLSKQKNAIFVVFVEGENELSTEMSSIIDDAAVVSRLSDQANFLAIKLKSGSTDYTHFAQIYQFVPVPSLFFIGRNGTPLEVVCAGVQPNNLATRIDRILEEHHKEKPSSVQPSTSAQSIKEQTVNLLQSEANVSSMPKADTAKRPSSSVDSQPENSSGQVAKVQKTEHTEVTKSGQQYEVVCDGDVCVRRPAGDRPGPSQPSQPSPPSDPPAAQQSPPTQIDESPSSVSITPSEQEKLDRAKELIEARRREKEAKEKELEKQKELERRATGQGVTELKKWQAEQELKQIQEERKREKMENDLARQRILAQIAQDRAERRARDSVLPATAGDGAGAADAGAGAARAEGAGAGAGAGGSARVQFKLADGASHTAHFDANGTLAQLHTYVAENLQMSASSFSLWTAFPRRELTEPGATLRELQLAPSAALLVLPRRTSPAPVVQPSALSTLIAFFTQLFSSIILEPSRQAYTWLRSFLFPPPAGRDVSPAPRGAPPPPAGPALRRRGNIHRLPGDSAGDDDNNTWNGNSTQQM